ncbi:MAG TPA: hypothetical protein DCY00_07585 [Actinobacteria bacterium]|nr:hypothetical protein [Actinomycetota bacterium]
MIKKFLTLVIMLVFALLMTSCISEEGKKNEITDNNSATSSQTTVISEETEKENIQTTETTIADDEKKDLEIKETNPAEGEYFVYAILKNIDKQNNTITVEQLINEPNEKEIQPDVVLSDECQIIKIVLEKSTEKETFTEISLDDIVINSEIGIIFRSDNTARAVILQEIK